ncbi:MAG: hypothetical protein HC881_14420, partial [Leptolyngbyaceae cyanobacterium SL_7_1]|nr:hypothetical protein [Leptolyngbyaceae cyanobacterium SL_7_1]
MAGTGLTGAGDPGATGLVAGAGAVPVAGGVAGAGVVPAAGGVAGAGVPGRRPRGGGCASRRW